jgi:hypothetical protein
MQSNQVGSFSLKALRERLPSDGATRYVKVVGVPSAMSHRDVCDLLQVPLADQVSLRWAHSNPVLRTDFVAEMASVGDARSVVAHVNSGITFLESRLSATYAKDLSDGNNGASGAEPPEALFGGCQQFTTEPKLYYVLPPSSDRDVARRRAEAMQKIAHAPIKPRGWWVNERAAE